MESDVDNKEMIIDEVGEIARFLINGFGYVIVIDGKIQGFCTTEYHAKNELALGIEVLPAYQRKGYAKTMVSAALKTAISKRYKVYWDCWQYNTPSINTALSCGFQHAANYPIIFLNFEE